MPVSLRCQQLISAAVRHVRDAEGLLRAGHSQSIDQAHHLAGFGPECARKACLSGQWADKAAGHGFGPAADEVIEVALALDASARRYLLTGLLSEAPALASWSPNVRYNATGTAETTETKALVEQSRALVDRIVLALWADGELVEVVG